MVEQIRWMNSWTLLLMLQREIIRKGFHEKKNIEHKGTVDLVTETDKACEDLIFNHLKLNCPDHKFIGEETTAACGVTELTDHPTWIVDPLDGTTNFVMDSLSSVSPLVLPLERFQLLVLCTTPY